MGVRIYAAARSEALKRFLAALRWRFRFGVALLVPFLRCGMPVEAQFLLVWRFVGVGSILYRVNFPRLVGLYFGSKRNTDILPIFPIFSHFSIFRS